MCVNLAKTSINHSTVLSSYGYPSSYAPPGTATYSSGGAGGGSGGGGGGGYSEDNSDDYYVDEEVDAPWNRDYDDVDDDQDQVRESTG